MSDRETLNDLVTDALALRTVPPEQMELRVSLFVLKWGVKLGVPREEIQQQLDLMRPKTESVRMPGAIGGRKNKKSESLDDVVTRVAATLELRKVGP